MNDGEGDDLKKAEMEAVVGWCSSLELMTTVKKLVWAAYSFVSIAGGLYFSLGEEKW